MKNCCLFIKFFMKQAARTIILLGAVHSYIVALSPAQMAKYQKNFYSLLDKPVVRDADIKAAEDIISTIENAGTGTQRPMVMSLQMKLRLCEVKYQQQQNLLNQERKQAEELITLLNEKDKELEKAKAVKKGFTPTQASELQQTINSLNVPFGLIGDQLTTLVESLQSLYDQVMKKAGNDKVKAINSTVQFNSQGGEIMRYYDEARQIQKLYDQSKKNIETLNENIANLFK